MIAQAPGTPQEQQQTDPKFTFEKVATVTSAGIAALAMFRGYVVIGVADELRVVDVSEPTSPKVIASLNLDATISHIAIAGNVAYVTVRPDGARIIDLGDPRFPRQVGTLPVKNPGYFTMAVATNGSLAYTVEFGYFQAIDVSDVVHPISIGNAPFEAWSVWDIDYSAGHVFVCTGDNLVVFDVTTPDHPKKVLDLPSSGARNWHGMTIDGNWAYVGAQTAGLVIFDISNPAQPIEQSSLDLPGSFREPMLSGKLLFAPAGDAGLDVIDVSIPTHPTVIGTIDTQGDAWAVIVAQGTAYLAISDIGLYVIDVSSPAIPSILARMEGPSPAVNVRLSNNIAYVLMEFGKLLIYDITDITTPHLLSRLVISDSEGASGMAVIDDVIYILVTGYLDPGQEGRLAVVDVSDSKAPMIVRRIKIPQITGGIASCGKRLYIGGYDELTILDVSNTLAPQIIGRYRQRGIEPWRMVCDATYVYALGNAGSGTGFVALKVRDENAIEVTSYIQNDKMRFPTSIALSESNVIIGSPGGITFINISDPRSPRVRTALNIPDGLRYVSAFGSIGDYIYAGTTSLPQMWMLDTRYPDDPEVVGRSGLIIGGDAVDIAAQDDVVAIAAGNRGLVLWRRLDLTTATATRTATPTPVATVMPTPTPTPTRSAYVALLPLAFCRR